MHHHPLDQHALKYIAFYYQHTFEAELAALEWPSTIKNSFSHANLCLYTRHCLYQTAYENDI